MKLSEKIQLRALLKKLCVSRAGARLCGPDSCKDCHVAALMSELPERSK